MCIGQLHILQSLHVPHILQSSHVTRILQLSHVSHILRSLTWRTYFIYLTYRKHFGHLTWRAYFTHLTYRTYFSYLMWHTYLPLSITLVFRWIMLPTKQTLGYNPDEVHHCVPSALPVNNGVDWIGSEKGNGVADVVKWANSVYSSGLSFATLKECNPDLIQITLSLHLASKAESRVSYWVGNLSVRAAIVLFVFHTNWRRRKDFRHSNSHAFGHVICAGGRGTMTR
jgi:hypothetical protein